jgi:hypothetical protein
MLLRSPLVRRVGEKGYDARPLDGSRHFSLVNGASACDPLGKDLSSVGDIPSQFVNVLVIDVFRFIRAELADLFSPHAAAFFLYHGV